MQQKVALITGGARRVGAAIGRLLHAAGVDLMVHYRGSAAEARAMQSALEAQRPGSVALVQADLLNAAALPSMVSDTIKRFGRLDMLINNASSFFPTAVGEITDQGVEFSVEYRPSTYWSTFLNASWQDTPETKGISQVQLPNGMLVDPINQPPEWRFNFGINYSGTRFFVPGSV